MAGNELFCVWMMNELRLEVRENRGERLDRQGVLRHARIQWGECLLCESAAQRT